MKPRSSGPCRTCGGPPPSPYWPLNWLAVTLPRLFAEASRLTLFSLAAVLLLCLRLGMFRPLGWYALPSWWQITGLLLAPAWIALASSLALSVGPFLVAIFEAILTRAKRDAEQKGKLK